MTSVQLTISGAYFSNESIREKCRMWTIWGSVWLMCGLEWNRASLTISVTQTYPCLYSSQN